MLKPQEGVQIFLEFKNSLYEIPPEMILQM